MATSKGFIKDFFGNKLLPITRAELVLDSAGQIALHSSEFLAHFDETTGADVPGLITAAERRLISGNGSDVSTLYTKLGYINTGLSFGGNAVKFYDDNGALPINITSASEGGVVIGVTNDNRIQTVKLSLPELSTISKTATILKGITVDKFGRVTAVSDGQLSNAEIPDLEDKTIKDSTLTGCVTDELTSSSADNAIANKKYVDSKFNTVNQIATGALTFGGPINSDTILGNVLNADNENKFYKASSAFTLTSQQNIDGSTVNVKSGDTLIVCKNGSDYQFTHIPSGDDLSEIQVSENSKTVFSKSVGTVNFNFASPFSVSHVTNSSTATISIDQAGQIREGVYQGGYISAEDYQRFSQYASKSVTYTPTIVSATPGSYTIGTLEFGTNSTAIYGIDRIASLSLIDGTDTSTEASKALNPQLHFTQTGQAEVKISVTGNNGIVVKKTSDANIAISAENEIDASSTDYLSVSDGSKDSTKGYKFGVKLGSVDNQFNVVTNGLASVQFVHDSIRGYTLNYEFVRNSLDNSSNPTEYPYYYGSAALIAAITL